MKCLGDVDIEEHLRESSTQANYVCTASIDEFAKCLSEHFKIGCLSCLVAAIDFSLMADETADLAERAQLPIFIHYVDADDHKVKEKFFGHVEVIGNKSAEALFNEVCDVLKENQIDIRQMRFNDFKRDQHYEQRNQWIAKKVLPLSSTHKVCEL